MTTAQLSPGLIEILATHPLIEVSRSAGWAMCTNTETGEVILHMTEQEWDALCPKSLVGKPRGILGAGC